MMKFIKENIIWIVIIFFLSALFRLSYLDLIEFKSDEATTVYQTVQFFNQPYLIQRGLISGTGVYNFPLFNYLIVLFGIFSRDPQFLSWIIALVNSILVSVFFLLVRRYYDLMTAFLTAIFLAFSPWAVIFSRKIWAQDLINLFLIPFLFLLHELILRKNTKVVLPLFLILTLLIQLHGSGLFLLVTIVLILLVLRVRINFRSATVGILIGLIPAVPYVLFQINSLCPDCAAFSKYQQSFRSFDFNNIIRPFQIMTGLGYHFVLGRSYIDFIAMYPLISKLNYVFATIIPVTLIGILLIITKKQKYLFLLIYFITIPLLYLITKTTAYMHYFVIIIPVGILLLTFSITTIYSYIQSKFLRISVIVYFSILLISNITFLSFFYRFLDSQKRIDGDYGPIFSISRNFIEQQTDEYRNLPYYRELISYAYIYAQSDKLHPKLGEFFLEKGDKELAAEESKR